MGRASAIRGLHTFSSGEAFLLAAERDLSMPSGTSANFMQGSKLIAGGNGVYVDYHAQVGNGSTQMFRPFPGCIVLLHSGLFFDVELINRGTTSRPSEGESFIIQMFDQGGIKVRMGERVLDVTSQSDLALRISNDANIDFQFDANVPHRHLQFIFGPDGVQNISRYLGLPVPEVFRNLSQTEVPEKRGVVEQRSIAIRNFVESMWVHDVSGFLQAALMRMKVAELLCHFNGGASQTTEEEQRPLTFLESRKLNDARRILETTFCDPPTIAKLAAEVGLNRRKLTEGFRQLFGVSIGVYCRERRLEMAHELITTSAISISDAAAEAGYAYISSFSKAFTDHFGYSPIQARSGRIT